MRLVIAVCVVVLGACFGLVGYVAVSDLPGVGELVRDDRGRVVSAPRLPAAAAEQDVALEPLVPPTGDTSSTVDPVVAGTAAGSADVPTSGLTDVERRALDLVSGGTRFSSDGTPVRPPLSPAQAVEEAGPEPFPPGGQGPVSGPAGPKPSPGATPGPGPTGPSSGPTPSDPPPSEEPAPEPVPTEPVPSDPVPTEPVPTEPVPTEPVPTEPDPTDPVPSDPVPTEPVPTEPVPTEPVPSDPLPTDPTEPIPSDPTGVLPESPLP